MPFDEAFAECSRKGLRHVSLSNHGSSEIPAHYFSPDGVAALAPLSRLNCISTAFRLGRVSHVQHGAGEKNYFRWTDPL